MKKLLLFDIDGTLLVTGGSGKIALERAFLDLYGIPEAWGKIVPDGKTDPNIIDEIATHKLGRKLSCKEHSKICDVYLRYFDEEIEKTHKFRLMPGVFGLLSEISKRENLLAGVATGNLEPAGWLKLKRGNIRNFFTFGGFSSDSRNRTEIVRIAIDRAQKILGNKIDRGNIFVIGDTHHDVRAARGLNVKAVAVTTGSYKAEHFLNGDQPDYLLGDLSDPKAFFALTN